MIPSLKCFLLLLVVADDDSFTQLRVVMIMHRIPAFCQGQFHKVGLPIEINRRLHSQGASKPSIDCQISQRCYNCAKKKRVARLIKLRPDKESIKVIRKDMGVTPEEFVAMLCVSTQALSKWETSNSLPI